jgi:hypothetical protein
MLGQAYLHLFNTWASITIKIYLVRKVIYFITLRSPKQALGLSAVVLGCNCKAKILLVYLFISSHKKRNRQCCRKEWQNAYNILLFAACKKDQATKFSLGSYNRPVHLGLKCFPWDPTNNNSKVISRILLVLMWETVDKKTMVFSKEPES